MNNWLETKTNKINQFQLLKCKGRCGRSHVRPWHRWQPSHPLTPSNPCTISSIFTPNAGDT